MKHLGKWTAVFIIGMAGSFFGCKVEPPKPPLVRTLAVLPFDSEANNINAPDIMQNLIIRALRPSAYEVLDPQTVKDKLEKAGIVDGGQLPALDPVKLGKDLGVQALLYGNVTSFNYVNIGFYMQRKVGLELKLVDVTTGQTLWENMAAAANTKVALDKDAAGQNLAKGLAEQAIEKIAKTPLQEEAMQAAMKTLRTLPGFIFVGFATGDDKNEAAKSVGTSAIKNQIWK